ncbi:MAG: hypothetical protein J6J17_01730 [Bacilli bacterium]|nr:hypothetical protein [Bacilli bacterium]
MEKFSYALEFYKRNLFDFENIKLFERKVKEAKEIEKYYLQVVPNTESIRKYIIRSYILNRKYNRLARINYIKGLIYADDYINFDDIIDFQEYLDENIVLIPKISLWGYKGYSKEDSEDEYLDNRDCSIVELPVCCDFTSYEYDELIDEIEEEESCEIDENIIIIDEKSEIIMPEEKIKRFKKLAKKYVDKTIENKKIDKNSVYMVKRGMNDWINFTITTLEEIYNLKEKSLMYTDTNIGDYI